MPSAIIPDAIREQQRIQQQKTTVDPVTGQTKPVLSSTQKLQQQQATTPLPKAPWQRETQPAPSVQPKPQSWASLGYPQYEGKYKVPTIKEGYELSSVKEQETSRLTPGIGREQPGAKQLEVTLKPKEVWVPTQLFGPKVGYYDPTTGQWSEQLGYGKGAPIVEVVKGFGPSPHEQAAISGLGLATVTATGVAVPTLGVFALGGIGVGETVKVGIIGKHLTLEEAITVAGLGELVGLGAYASARALQPRVQRGLETSFRSAVESGELWTPSLTQKVGMKLTGAQPPRLAQEIVGAGEAPPVGFKMLSQKSLGAPEEEYFWKMPTPRSSQIYVARVLGSRAKTWAGEHLIKRVSGGLSYALIRQELELEKPITVEMPYIPKEPYITEEVVSAKVSPIVALLVTAKLTQAQRIIQVQRLTPKTTPTQILKETSVLKEEVATAQIQRQTQVQAQVLKQVQTQTQTQKQIQKQALISPLIPSITQTHRLFAFPPLLLGGGGGEGAGRRVSGGLWRVKKHPIPSSEEITRSFLGAPRKRTSARTPNVNRATRDFLGSKRKSTSSENFFSGNQRKRRRG